LALLSVAAPLAIAPHRLRPSGLDIGFSTDHLCRNGYFRA
jgi:hypothetical protein